MKISKVKLIILFIFFLTPIANCYSQNFNLESREFRIPINNIKRLIKKVYLTSTYEKKENNLIEFVNDAIEISCDPLNFKIIVSMTELDSAKKEIIEGSMGFGNVFVCTIKTGGLDLVQVTNNGNVEFTNEFSFMTYDKKINDKLHKNFLDLAKAIKKY